MKKKTFFTIKRLLELKTIKGLRLAAGKSGIDNSIYNANIIDNPDSFEWFNPGDFLMSSGYLFQTSQTTQRKIIKELAERNCAGLGIKIHRYWDKVPEPIIDECNKLKLPLITIPYNYSLSQISNEINNEIYFRENSLLNRYKKIQDSFTNCSFEKNVVENILKILGSTINNSILLLDSKFQLLNYFEHSDEIYKMEDLFDLNIRTKCFDQNFLIDIPATIEKLPVSIKRLLTINNREIICKIFPIVYSKNIYGYFIVLETLKKLDYLDLIAIENASLFVSLDRIKTKQIEEALVKEKENFFDDLIQDKIVSMNALKSLSKMYGLDPDKKYIIATISLNSYNKTYFANIINILSSFYNIKNMGFQYICRRSFLILFIPYLSSLSDKKIYTLSEDLINNFIEELNKQEIDFNKIAIGPICNDFSEIGKTVLITMDILKLAVQIKYNKPICRFKDIQSFYFLSSSVKIDDLKIFYKRVLGELEKHDRNSNDNLVNTLDYYFQANQNISASSKLMGIHRNTFLYRLRKIKTLLNDEFNHPELLFQYQIALHIKKII